MRTLQCAGLSPAKKRCTRQANFIGESILTWWCRKHKGQARSSHEAFNVSLVDHYVPLGPTGAASTYAFPLSDTGM